MLTFKALSLDLTGAVFLDLSSDLAGAAAGLAGAAAFFSEILKDGMTRSLLLCTRYKRIELQVYITAGLLNHLLSSESDVEVVITCDISKHGHGKQV